MELGFIEVRIFGEGLKFLSIRADIYDIGISIFVITKHNKRTRSFIYMRSTRE